MHRVWVESMWGGGKKKQHHHHCKVIHIRLPFYIIPPHHHQHDSSVGPAPYPRGFPSLQLMARRLAEDSLDGLDSRERAYVL